MGCGTAHPRATRRGREGVPERGEGGGHVESQKRPGGEGHGGRRDAWRRDEQEGDVRKRGSQRTKKKRKEIKKNALGGRSVTPHSRHAFVSGRARRDRGMTRGDVGETRGDTWCGGDATRVPQDEGTM